MKKFEQEVHDYIIKTLKHFDKNALGDKIQKKKIMKESMLEEYEKLKKKIAHSKNQALDQLMNNVNDSLYTMVNENVINSIFEIGERYDDII